MRVHELASTLCVQLDDSAVWPVWPLGFSHDREREQTLRKVERRLLNMVRWSVYVINTWGFLPEESDEGGTLTAETPRADNLRPLPDEVLRRLIDAQIELAAESKRLLKLVDRNMSA